MNVLEKILEEIEERIKRLKEADNMCRVNAERNRNFESMKYFQDLMFATERAESIIGDIIRSHMDDVPKCGECSRRKWYQIGYEDGKKNDGWIPVSEKLPEAGDGKYYPLLNVQTSYGAVKCGFYRVRDDRWYIYEEFYNEFIETNEKEVVAWQTFPEPYKEG
nr:MAG TPA: Protein of unknown function (DUF551) [Caudoviricetes sp.]